MVHAHSPFPSLTLLPIISLLAATYKGHCKVTFLISAIVALFPSSPSSPNGSKCRLSRKKSMVLSADYPENNSLVCKVPAASSKIHKKGIAPNPARHTFPLDNGHTHNKYHEAAGAKGGPTSECERLHPWTTLRLRWYAKEVARGPFGKPCNTTERRNLHCPIYTTPTNTNKRGRCSLHNGLHELHCLAIISSI